MSPRPLAYDPVLGAYLTQMPPKEEVMGKMFPKLEDILPDAIVNIEQTITGPDKNEIKVSIFHRKGRDMAAKHNSLGLYNIHGGGMIAGDRYTSVSWPLDMVDKLDAVCVNIEYRLAPAYPYPAGVEDCYAGLVWMAEHAAELGVDPARILVTGSSAGGGLAAAMTLLARDRKGPKLFGQALFSPMLDDRDETDSARQFEGLGVWDRKANLMGWTALLGEKRGTEDVSMYAAPARASDLSGLPPAYIDASSTETFRDEDVQYAQKLWRDGVQCELHIWPGA